MANIVCPKCYAERTNPWRSSGFEFACGSVKEPLTGKHVFQMEFTQSQECIRRQSILTQKNQKAT